MGQKGTQQCSAVRRGQEVVRKRTGGSWDKLYCNIVRNKLFYLESITWLSPLGDKCGEMAKFLAKWRQTLKNDSPCTLDGSGCLAGAACGCRFGILRCLHACLLDLHWAHTFYYRRMVPDGISGRSGESLKGPVLPVSSGRSVVFS